MKREYSFGIAVGLILALQVALGLLVIDRHVGFNDAATYMHQAKSLIDGTLGEFLENNLFTIEHSVLVGPLAYPWGFPLIIALVYALFGMNVFIIKYVNLAFFVALLVGLALSMRRKFPLTVIVGVLAGIAFHSLFLGYINTVMTDIIFASVAFLSLSTFRRLLHRWPQSLRKQTLRCVAIAFLAILPIAFRLNGIVVACAMAGALLLLLLRRQCSDKKKLTSRQMKRYALLSIWTAFFFLSVLLLLHRAFPEATTLASHRFPAVGIPGMMERIRGYTSIIAGFFSLNNRGVVVIAIPLFIGIPWGMWKRKWEDLHLILFCFGTVALYFLLRMPTYDRYLLCVLPLLWYFAVVGLYDLGAWMHRLLPSMGWKVFSLFLTYGFILWFLQSSVQKAFHPPSRILSATGEPIQSAYAFIREHTPEDAVIVGPRPQYISFYANRRAIFRYDRGLEKFGDYILVNSDQKQWFNVDFTRYENVFDNALYSVYKIH